MSSLQVYPRNICESRGFQFCNGRIIFFKENFDDSWNHRWRFLTKDNRIEELEERGRGDFELWILNFCN